MNGKEAIFGEKRRLQEAMLRIQHRSEELAKKIEESSTEKKRIMGRFVEDPSDRHRDWLKRHSGEEIDLIQQMLVCGREMKSLQFKLKIMA